MSKEKQELKNVEKDLLKKLPENVREVIEALPKEEQEAFMTVIAVQESTEFSGPIPHPSILVGYEKVLPGSANRILKMAENQSKHRIELEKEIYPSIAKQGERGQLYAFLLVLTTISSGVYLTVNEHEMIASVLFGITIIGVAAMFIGAKVNLKGKDNELSVNEDN